MTDKVRPGLHWLINAARKAGLSAPDDFSVDPRRPLREAWPLVARAFGASDDQLAQAVAAHFRLEVADTNSVPSHVVRLVPESVARRYNILPLQENDRQLLAATADPTNADAEQELAFACGRAVTFKIAPPEAITLAINTVYTSNSSFELLLAQVDERGSDVRVVEESLPETASLQDIETAPIIRLANHIIRDGIVLRASDIHIEPQGGPGVVRMRIDGVLRPHMQLPAAALNQVISRIKILSKLDIADRLRPQDGKTRVEVDGAVYDLRVSTVPARASEKAVIRILRPTTAGGIADLQLSSSETQRIQQLLSFREGIIIITGPTGSGKTTSLYAALRDLATGRVNIMTVEDPIEYELHGITQMQVDAKRGVTFATALRSMLRQDPDVLFVGEIRDAETAAVALQASMTGHLVLATLHTNDASGVIPRMEELGAEPAALASALRGIIAQRLVRRVCPQCAVQLADSDLTPRETELAAASGVRPTVRAIGCRACGDTGYFGRLPIVEILMAGPDIQRLISDRASAARLRDAALENGMQSLRESALTRVMNGETTLEEVDRVVGQVKEQVEEAATESPQILVVDDDAICRRLAAALLQRNGFQVTEAVNGEEAMQRIMENQQFSLIVLDLNMPKLDGWGVLARLRGDLRTAALPVIVLTGSGDLADEIKLMERGADDYVRKPLDAARFIARVRAVLGRTSMMASAED